MKLIDWGSAVIKVDSHKEMTAAEPYGYKESGKLRFNLTIMAPGYIEAGAYYPAQSINVGLAPKQSEELVKALRQPTSPDSLRERWGALKALELSKPAVPGAVIEISDQLLNTLIKLLKETERE
jgi:hypothetical protein